MADTVFVVKLEDLYAGCDCGECSCWSPAVWETIGVFSTREKVNEWMKRKRALAEKYGYNFREDLYDVEEISLDEEP